MNASRRRSAYQRGSCYQDPYALQRAQSKAAPSRPSRAACCLAPRSGSGILWACVVASWRSAAWTACPCWSSAASALLGTAALLPVAQPPRGRARGPGGNRRRSPGWPTIAASTRSWPRQLERARRGRAPARPGDAGPRQLQGGQRHARAPVRRRGAEVDRQGASGIAVSGTDTAARVGGEEFALIVPGTDGEAAYRIAERARDAIAARLGSTDIDLSCSAGVATYPDDAEDASSLCQLAEGALYWAKRRGKGRTRRFDPGHVPLAWTRRRRRPRSPRCSAEPERDHVGLPAGGRPGQRAPGRLRGAGAVLALAGALAGGVVRAGSRLRPRDPTWRRRRSAPRSSRWADRSGPTSRSTSARRPSPRSRSSDALPSNLDGHRDRDHGARVRAPTTTTSPALSAELRERGARIAIDDAGAGYAGLTQVMRVRPDIVKLDRNLTKRDPRRSGADGAGGVVRPLRPAHRRDRLRRGDREPRRPGRARRPRRPVGAGVRARPPGGAMGARLAGRRRGLPGVARPGAARQPGRRAEADHRRRPAARAPERPACRALAPARTSRARWP